MRRTPSSESKAKEAQIDHLATELQRYQSLSEMSRVAAEGVKTELWSKLIVPWVETQEANFRAACLQQMEHPHRERERNRVVALVELVEMVLTLKEKQGEYVKQEQRLAESLDKAGLPKE